MAPSTLTRSPSSSVESGREVRLSVSVCEGSHAGLTVVQAEVPATGRGDILCTRVLVLVDVLVTICSPFLFHEALVTVPEKTFSATPLTLDLPTSAPESHSIRLLEATLETESTEGEVTLSEDSGGFVDSIETKEAKDTSGSEGGTEGQNSSPSVDPKSLREACTNTSSLCPTAGGRIPFWGFLLPSLLPELTDRSTSASGVLRPAGELRSRSSTLLSMAWSGDWPASAPSTASRMGTKAKPPLSAHSRVSMSEPLEDNPSQEFLLFALEFGFCLYPTVSSVHIPVTVAQLLLDYPEFLLN
ncbi:hypothetical protein E2C01_019288 [Portunus trituberculatus]|uniref:Uncharacterized protein n=1 Tax=Portunus trituberculatus TaxID=210409 RepID=A0A5B7DYS4_PORTR|nr:hypothetical protein [Portunus trituberculatus]